MVLTVPGPVRWPQEGRRRAATAESPAVTPSRPGPATQAASANGSANLCDHLGPSEFNTARQRGQWQSLASSSSSSTELELDETINLNLPLAVNSLN